MSEIESNLSDEALLDRAKKGSKAAFERFYDRHKRRIINYAYRMTGNLKAAEDITQETFIRAYVNLRSYVPREKALNWVYTISGNLCRNFLRDSRFDPQASLDEELPGVEGLSLKDMIPHQGQGPAETAAGREEAELIQRHINLLPVKYREILVLCDIQGYSYEEVARILRCRAGSVGSRLSRARIILAQALKKYYK